MDRLHNRFAQQCKEWNSVLLRCGWGVIWPIHTGFHGIWLVLRCFLVNMCIKLLMHLYWIERSGFSILSEIAEGQVCDLVFYPEPALISAVVSLALLLPLPPLYQAGRMVPRQADVTAAGCGTDSSPDASEEEGLGAEWQLHPTRQRHEERAIGADSVWTLSMVFFWGGGVMGGSNTYKDVTQNHTCKDANMQ